MKIDFTPEERKLIIEALGFSLIHELNKFEYNGTEEEILQLEAESTKIEKQYKTLINKIDK